MADAKRTVDVAINVTGTNTEQLTKLADRFASIGKAVQTAVEAVNTLKTSLDSLQAPKGLKDIVNSFKELASIKVSNIKQIVQEFERLFKIKTPPDLGKFVDELKKFSNIKVPNIKSLSQGLEKLTASTLDMQGASARLRVLYRNLKSFSDINVSNISKITKSLVELNRLSGINIQTKSLTALSDALQKLNGLKAPNLTPLINGLKKLVDINIGDSSKKLSQLASVLNQFGDRKLPSVTSLVNGLKKLISLDIGRVVSKIRELNGALKSLDQAGHLKSFAGFANNLNTISASLGNAKKALDGYNVRVREAANNTKAFGERVKNYLQYRLIADSVINIKDALIGTFNAIKDYDQALKDLQAITGATSLEVEQMGITIKEVASTTKFSAQEVAEGMRTLGQAGFSASEAIQTMQAVSDLATGTLSDMSTTVDLVTTAMRVFKIDASQSAMVADTFANAVNRSKLTIDKLRIAMNYVGPIAQKAGVSFEEMSASMMTLANSGLRASTIGTGLRRVFAELVDPSEKLEAAARKAGIALSDLDPQTRGLKEVIANLGIVVNDTQTAFDIFGKRGAAAVLALSDTEGQFNSMLETVSRSGTAAQMAGTQMEGLGVSFKNLKDKIGLFAVAIGDTGITDALRVIINVARGVVDVFTAIINTGFVKFIGKSAALVAAIWGIHTAFVAILKLNIGMNIGILIGKMYAFAAATTTAQTASKGLLLALNPLIAVLGLVAASVVYMFATLDSAKEAAKDAAVLADEYSNLGKVFQNHQVKVSTMEEGSKELGEANKALRTSLLETASGMTNISDEAAKAAASIHPLTGEIADNGEALKAYNNELSNLNFKQLAQSAQSAEENVAKQASGANRFLNRWKDAFKQVGTLGKGVFDSAIAGFEGDFEKIPAILQKTTAKTTEYGAQIQEALDFSLLLEDNSVSFKKFSDYVNSLNFSNLNSQQRDLVESFKLLNERSDALFQNLRDSGKIDMTDTVESIQAIIEKEGIVGLELDAIMVKVRQLKEIDEGTFSNIIEKWASDAKDGKTAIAEFVDEFKKMGGKISAEQEAQIILSQKQKDALISKYKQAKVIFKQEIDAGKDRTQAYKKFHTEEMRLLALSAQIRKSDAENSAAQIIINLQKAQEAYKKSVDEYNATYKDRADLLVKYLVEAETKFEAAKKSIISGVLDPEQLLSDTKVTVKEIQEAYSIMYKELEFAALHEGANKKALNAEKRRLEKEEAEKIKTIWIDVDERINNETGPDSNSAIAAKMARLNAQIAEGKLTVAQAKKIAEEVAKAGQDAYETANAQRETSHSLHLSRIASAEANNIITHEQAEQAKLSLTLEYYDTAYQKAKEYFNKVDKEQNPAEYQKRLDALLSAEKKYYDEKKRYIDKYNKEVETLYNSLDKKDDDRERKARSHNQKLFTINKSYIKKRGKVHEDYIEKKKEADKDYSEEIESIEKDLAEEIKSINEDLYDDLEDISDARIENAKDLKAALSGIEEDTADKIRRVNQRGMTDRQKDRDNEKAAYAKLAKAKELQREAERTGNKELANQAKGMIDQVQGLASEFDNAKTAKSLLYKSGDALKENARIKSNIDNLELEKKAVDAIAEAEKKKAEAREKAAFDKKQAGEAHREELNNIEDWKTKKLAAAKEANEEAIRLESQRHSNEMSDLDKEIAKLQEKLTLADRLRKASSSDTLGDGESTSGSTDSPGSSDSTKALEDIQKVADETVLAIQKIDQQSVETSNTVSTDLATSLSKVSKDASKGFEEFVVVTTETGQKVITTANSMAQGFTAFGQSVRVEPLVAVKELGTEVENVGQKSIDIKVQDNTEEVITSFKSLTGELEAQRKELSEGIVTDEAMARLDETRQKITDLFSGLEASSPEQKVADMVTLFDALQGKVSESTLMDFFQEIQTEAEKLKDPVEVQLQMDGAETTISLLGNTGAELEKLKGKFESNPFDLSKSFNVEEVSAALKDVDGLIDAVKENAKENVQLELDTDQAEQEVKSFEDQTSEEVEMTVTADVSSAERELDSLEDKEVESVVNITATAQSSGTVPEVVASIKKEIDGISETEPEVTVKLDKSELDTLVRELEDKVPEEVEMVVTADVYQAEQALESLEDKEVETVVNITATATTSGTVPEIVKYIKKEIESISETEPEVIVKLDKRELDTLIKELKDITSKDHDVKVSTTVTGTDDLKTLLTWLETIDKHNPKDVDVTADVAGTDEVVTLKQTIDSLINKTVKIIASVSGIADVRNLHREIDKLKDKTVTITTRYVTKGSPPSEAKASGGEVQGFNTGGSVFRKLASPFISKGSGAKDDVPAMLMKGEFVHKVSAVKKYGRNFMDMVNAGLFPIELARKAVPHFAGGGQVEFDLNSSSIVQNFAKGGFVLSGMIGSLRKKLYELFGSEVGTNLNVETVNFQNTLETNSKNIKSELGVESINKMTESFTETVQQFYRGGPVRKIDSAKFDNTVQSINTVYDDLISAAHASGGFERAAILEKERLALLEISAELKAKIQALTDEYNEDIADAEENHDESVADAEENYNESVADREERHKETLADAQEDYNESVADAEENYNESVADAQEDYNNTREDYDGSVTDREELYAEALAAAREAYEESVADSRGSYDGALADAQEDYNNTREDYDGSVTDREERHEETLSDAQVAYNESVADAQEEYDDTKKEYDENTADNLVEYNEEKADIEEEYERRFRELWSDLIDAKSSAREAVEEVNTFGRTMGAYVRDGRTGNNYPHEELDIPFWFQLKSAVETYWNRQNVGFDTRATGREDSLDTAEEKWAAWLDALSALEDLGVDKPEWVVTGRVNIKNLASSMSREEKQAALEAAKAEYTEVKVELDKEWTDYKADYNEQLSDLLSDYNETKADESGAYTGDIAELDNEWTDYRTDYNENIVGQDSDHNEQLADLLSDYNETKDNENESYDEDLADYLENWTDYKADYNENIAERDSDHEERLADLLSGYNETKADENESYDEDLADYLENYSDTVKSADETLADAFESLLESYNDSVESENASAEDSTKARKEETATELNSLRDKLMNEGASKDDATAMAQAMEEKNTETKRRLSMDDLLKRIGSGLFSFNTGGEVPHTSFSIPGKDSIMAALTPGEFVMKEGVVSHFGAGFFDALNNFRIPRFNTGGVVGTIVNDFQKTIASSEVKHALELNINGTSHEPLYGSQMGIDEIINSLEMAKMRS